ncbi:carbonic anhydrase [Thalassospira profundimaris]|uniref:Carbonic anhydrase n=1 Tax=Thalassospira profundimaris TaxID=502049 RepID=A0A367XNB3_9PROT|nr:carbonic anhydrase [Thalassospira profundimaris]MDC7232970.1 carbonic anhydrase [Spirochaetales bacterium]RCK54232.1 carbonic anhydrase [Thalassospira profundimaris]
MAKSTVERMLAGFKSFKAMYYEQRPERVTDLMNMGQKPEVLLIACSDSRVDPAILTNAEPGEMFVIRNVANLVPPYEPDENYHGTSSAIEFAVRDLKVRDIVILGHSACGGIQALVEHGEAGKVPERDFIGEWVSMAKCCLEHGPDVDEVSRRSIGNSLQNLMTFPYIQERVAAGDLNLHGWWFGMKEGILWRYDAATDEFVQGDE